MSALKKDAPKRKLHSTAGETIAETLIGVLISALALVMLAGAISATAKMITSSDQKMEQYYKNDAALAKMTGSNEMTVTITATDVDENRTVNENRTVTYAENSAFTSKPVVAYKTKSLGSQGSVTPVNPTNPG